MSEDDIALWESKIKTSLLRRDDTLTSITSSLRSTLTISSGVTTTGFTFKNLSSLGIVTGNYTEKGLLHIEGDEDDSIFSVKTNKLRNAINENPDAVMELMTAIGTKIYSDMNTRMKSSTVSSALTFYNDKTMTKTISAFDTKISDLEDKLTAIESRYYKQFTAMEQAIQRSNSTGDWLTQQLSGM
jgi:flagellar hook-associated protein 2